MKTVLEEMVKGKVKLGKTTRVVLHVMYVCFTHIQKRMHDTNCKSCVDMNRRAENRVDFLNAANQYPYNGIDSLEKDTHARAHSHSSLHHWISSCDTRKS